MSLNKNTIERVKLLLNDGKSITKIAEEIGMNRKTLSFEMKQLGLESKYNKSCSNELIEEIYQKVLSGQSITQLAKEYNMDRKKISKEIKKLHPDWSSPKDSGLKLSKGDVIDIYNEFISSGLTLREYSDKSKYTRNTLSNYFHKYDLDIPKDNGSLGVNETYFAILNEDSTYWLGFLLADGYIDKTESKFELSLKDLEHVEKFKKSIECGCKITERHPTENSTVYRINITNKNFCKHLVDLGCINNKTYSELIISDRIPKEFERDFIRGFFEGDGYYVLDNAKEPTKVNTIGIVSYKEESLNKLAKIIEQNLGVTGSIRKSKDRVPALEYYGQDKIRLISNWMYKDCNLYLDRKFKLYKELIAVDRE